MNIVNRLLSLGISHGRNGKELIPKGITVHYVGNPGSSAEANRNWFEGGAGGANTSAHYIIGLQGEILLCVPENERAAHAGKSYGNKWDEMAKTNNSNFIGIEVCHPAADGKFNEKTMASLVWLCADMCDRYGFDPQKCINRHYDITGKQCPIFYVRNKEAWLQILKNVEEAMEKVETIKAKFIENGKEERVEIERIFKRDQGVMFFGGRKIAERAGFTVKLDADGNTPIFEMTTQSASAYLAKMLNCSVRVGNDGLPVFEKK